MCTGRAGVWTAVWPPAQHTSSGAATRSSNPVVDYHVIYGISAAVTYAGRSWGLGRWWAELPMARKNRWLL